MGIIISTPQVETHGASSLPSYERHESHSKPDQNLRMLERYYETGEGKFDIDRKRLQDRRDRRDRRLHPEQREREDSTERIEIHLRYPDATKSPEAIRVVHLSDSSDETRSSEDGYRTHNHHDVQEPRGRREEHIHRHHFAQLPREAIAGTEKYIARACGDETTLNLQCFFFDEGIPRTSPSFAYKVGTRDDHWLAEKIQKQYETMDTKYRSPWHRFFAPSKLSFVKFVKFEWGKIKKDKHPQPGWTTTHKRNIVPSKCRITMTWFEHKLKDPDHDRHWLKTLDELIEPNSIVKIQLLETLNKKMIYSGLCLAAASSVIFAAVYGAVRKDWSTAFSGASWIVTFFALLGAVFAAKTWLGTVEQELDDIELADDEKDVDDRILETEENILRFMKAMAPMGRSSRH